MRLQRSQLEKIADGALKRKLRDGMMRDAPGFAELSDEQQADFVADALSEAADWGFRTPQGFAAYALGLWFLQPGFPATSQYLRRLLESTVPEVRKTHAMNEWVSAVLGAPDNMAAADNKLREAFYGTAAWGRQG